MRLTVERQIALAFALAFALLTTIGVLTYRTTRHLAAGPSVRETQLMILIYSFAAISFVAFAGFAVFRELRRRRQSEEAVRRESEELAGRLARQDEELFRKTGEWQVEFRKRIKAEETERLSREWWRVTLASVGDGVITTDTAGHVNYINAVAQSITGWRQHEAAGRLLDEIFRVDDEDQEEVVLHTRDGRQTPVDHRLAPIRDDQGETIGAVIIFRDVTEERQVERARRQAEETMRESEEEFRRIFETANEGIWLLDVAGRTTRVNAKMAAMLAYSEAEMSGLAMVDLLEDGAREEARANLADPSPGFFEGHDFLFRRRDGSELWADLSVTPIVNAAGERQGTLAMVTDITQRKQAEAERERLLEREQIARRDAEVANRLKDEFLATVSHELRAPLNAILGWVRLLRSNRLDETAAAGALETIERSAQNQNRLIEDLLDVSRIIAGKLRLDIRLIDLNVALKAALETIRPAAEAKEITLDPHFDPQAPLISGDSNRLQQVIWNLLSNAVKFTPQGGHISVTLAHTESKVEATVVDNGQGIRPEFLPYVFDRFRQADSSSRRKHGGLGLGLAIVRHLVELHGGTVYVFSDGEGTGATFRVELPVPAPTIASTPVSTQSPAARPPSNTEKVLDGLRVLVVDDHDDARKLVAQILKSHGATVAPASTAAEAYDQFVRQRPDILVSDIGMPEEDGYSLISRIRELEAGRGTATPAIALTAYAQASDRLRALGAGFQNHLTKPVEPLELVTAIASLTGRINQD